MQVIATVCKLIPLALLMVFGFIIGKGESPVFTPMVDEGKNAGTVLVPEKTPACFNIPDSLDAFTGFLDPRAGVPFEMALRISSNAATAFLTVFAFDVILFSKSEPTLAPDSSSNELRGSLL